jgi:hypothetical protein
LGYRHDYGLVDSSYTSGAAQSFEKSLRLLDDDGVPLERPLLVP